MRKIDFYGAQMIFDGADFVSLTSTYEPEETTMALTLFNEGDTVLVAGCGAGWLATMIATVANQVIGVEPIPYLAEAARQNIQVDGEPLLVLDGVLSNGEGNDGLFFVRDHWLESSGIEDEQTAHQIIVSPLNVDDLFFTYPINALALDIEGGEADLLLGMADDTLLSFKKLLIEYHMTVIGADKAAAIQQRLADLGFIETESKTRFTFLSIKDRRPTREVRCVYRSYIQQELLPPFAG